MSDWIFTQEPDVQAAASSLSARQNVISFIISKTKSSTAPHKFSVQTM